MSVKPCIVIAMIAVNIKPCTEIALDLFFKHVLLATFDFEPGRCVLILPSVEFLFCMLMTRARNNNASSKLSKT